MDEQLTKKWYKSKTIWVNAFALAVAFALSQFNFSVTSEETASALVIVNLILRAITGQGLEK